MPEETVTEIEEQAPEKKQEHRAEQTTISEYLESLLVTVILALFGTSFIVQAFKIPSASMEGTLLIGDHLLVNKFIFGGTGAWYEKLLPYRQLERGDISFSSTLCGSPAFREARHRLAGRSFETGRRDVFINGKRLYEPYAVMIRRHRTIRFNYSFPSIRAR